MLYLDFCGLLSILLFLNSFVTSIRLKRLSTANYDEKVYNNDAKYVVSIRSRTPSKFFGDNHYCGGSLISPIFVLTSAHCVMSKRKKLCRSRLLLVVAGSPNRLRYTQGETFNIPVTNISVPINFVMFNTPNIAVLKLKSVLPKAHPAVGYLSLPTKSPEFGKSYRVLGWGRLYEDGILAAKIVYLDLKLQEPSLCQSLIKSFNGDMLCAANFNESDESPCPGDSGDPLIKNTTLYGISTYGLGCGNRELPAVFSNVFQQLDFITEITTASTDCIQFQKRHLFKLFLINFLMSFYYK